MDASTTSIRLTDHERWIIQRARETAPALRDGDIQEKLAAELLAQLADLAERLASLPDG